MRLGTFGRTASGRVRTGEGAMVLLDFLTNLRLDGLDAMIEREDGALFALLRDKGGYNPDALVLFRDDLEDKVERARTLVALFAAEAQAPTNATTTEERAS